MRKLAYMIFVDIWRLTCKYQFKKLNDQQWECFIADAEKLLCRYKDTEAESLFKNLFMAVQTFYEKQ